MVSLLCRLSRLRRSWRSRTAGSAAGASAMCRPTRSWTCGLCLRCWLFISSDSSSPGPAVTSLMSKSSSPWRTGTCQTTCHTTRYIDSRHSGFQPVYVCAFSSQDTGLSSATSRAVHAAGIVAKTPLSNWPWLYVDIEAVTAILWQQWCNML